MIIIVEGVDFSGKTTLVSQLANALGATAFKAHSKPKSYTDVLQWVADVQTLARGKRHVITDRSPLISEMIYGPLLRGISHVETQQAFMLLNILNLTCGLMTIVCDPGLKSVREMNNAQMPGVADNVEALWERYYAFPWPRMPGTVIAYNWRDHTPVEHIAGMVAPVEDYETGCIDEFHKKFQVSTSEVIGVLAPDVFEFRQEFLDEEIREFADATESCDVIRAFDSLIDLVYVAKGTALMMGITPAQWRAGFEAVHEANMQKVRTPSASASKRGSDLDVIKPEGWIGPEERLRDILS